VWSAKYGGYKSNVLQVCEPTQQNYGQFDADSIISCLIGGDKTAGKGLTCICFKYFSGSCNWCSNGLKQDMGQNISYGSANFNCFTTKKKVQSCLHYGTLHKRSSTPRHERHEDWRWNMTSLHNESWAKLSNLIGPRRLFINSRWFYFARLRFTPV